MSADVRVLLDTSMRSYAEWEMFDAKIAALLERGLLRQIQPLKPAQRYGEEWYIDTQDGELYKYVKPGDKTYPLWERVDPFSNAIRLSESCSNNLRIHGLIGLSPGTIHDDSVGFLQDLLNEFVQQGRVELVRRRPDKPEESWWREFYSGDTYRLTMRKDKGYSWERMDDSAADAADSCQTKLDL